MANTQKNPEIIGKTETIQVKAAHLQVFNYFRVIPLYSKQALN